VELKFIKTNKIPKDIKVYKRPNFSDKRGDFQRIFDYGLLKNFNIKQINFSFNKKKGTIRGMHFQIPSYSEKKIVSCVSGKILDVIVDIRKKSKNYLKAYSIILSSSNKLSLIIPPGYAHGFQTLEDNTKIVYLHSKRFSKKLYRIISPFNGKINFKWKIKNFIISKQDQNTINKL
jgi:dTDP-4-dehydrorhamnose 3,5-epimerase